MAVPFHKGDYSFVSASFTTATAATDVFVLVPQVGRIVAVKKILIYGSAATSLLTPVFAILRSSLNSGGSAVQITGAPRVMFGPSSPTTPIAPSVQCYYYTANPTTGTTHSVVDGGYLMCGANTAAIPTNPLVFDWSSSPVVLQGTATPIELVINLAGVTLPAPGFLLISVELQEY